MADLTPYVDLVEKVVDNPSSVQVDNIFTVGCVLPSKVLALPAKSVIKIRSQKELLKAFNGGAMIDEHANSMLMNAYRLVKSAMLIVRPADIWYTAVIAGSGYLQVKQVTMDADGDLIDQENSKIKNYSNIHAFIVFSVTKTSPSISGNLYANGSKLNLFSADLTPNNFSFDGLSTSYVSERDADKMKAFNIEGLGTVYARWFTATFEGQSSQVLNGTLDSAALTDAFDEMYYDETCVPTVYCDLGDQTLGTYMKSRSGAYYSSETGVLLRTAVFNALSGPNVGDERGSMFDADSMGMTDSMKAANGDQWIYHFPWGVDSKTASFSFDVAPSVLYLEAVVAARKAGHPYAGIYAHRFGVISDVKLKVILGRDDRDYLLGLGYNSIFKDERPRYNHTLIASNRTCTSLNNPMNKESHRRLANKLNNDVFVISEDFIGRQITDLLYEEIRSTMMSYIEGNIQVYPEALDEFDVVCDRTNNDGVDRANYIVNFDIYGKFGGEVDYVKILSTYFSVRPSEE